MRGSSAWSCSPCVVLLLSAIFGQNIAVSASHAGRQHQANRDVIHRVAKAQVTAMAVLKRQEGEGGGVCATDHALCPQSLSGGCCPSRYACAADSCFATTAGPTTGCGLTGHYPCSNGGCCRVGFICGKNNDECYPPASMTLTSTDCPANFYLCPASVNFGCCKSGMGCAVNGCYSTNPVTSTVTRTESFTSGTRVITTTTTAVFVATPTPPTGVPTPNAPDGEAKFIPTSVPKVPAQNPTNDSGSSGLSGAAIGGIVAGVVILLIVVVVAAFFIIRKLNKVVEVTEQSKRSASEKQTATKKSASQIQQMEIYGEQLHATTPYEDDVSMSLDPLYQTHASTPQPDGAAADAGRNRSDSHPGGFTPSPNMFHDRSRHASPDSNAGYFDHAGSALMQHNNLNQTPMQPARMRSSTDSNNRGAYHWRQQSNASELSADESDRGHSNVNSPLVIPELDSSGAFVELPGQGPDRGGSRSRSESAASRPHNRGRSDTQQSRSELGLSPLEEGIEFHGHYGRRGHQAGQTGAGLDEIEYDMTSPVDPGYIPSQSALPQQQQPDQGGYYSPWTPQPPPKS
ncbi:hypothetical protein QBC35DRAFT_554855 [Podospora australis]|uniref:Mid2 domain-containing protein n=1 Tax=Podospora australis TaxID=1536484 RepID=A0AAN7AGU4_9PEZI|nr:hypothetical protein QBC35DRAFT_554855 [Podospora australis]